MKTLLIILFNIVIAQTIFAQATFISYDINNDVFGSYPSFFTPYKGKLYFVALDSVHGSELHSIDSNTAPKLEFDIEPARCIDGVRGSATGYISCVNICATGFIPKKMAVTHDMEGKEQSLYFYGNGKPITNPKIQSRYFTLFRYDGVNKPYAVITDFGTGRIAGYNELVAIGDKVYFTVDTTGSQNTTIYEYNQALNIYTVVYAVYGGHPRNLVVFKGKLFFTDTYECHEFDPVTRKLTQLTAPAMGGTNGNFLPYPRVIGDKLYFVDENRSIQAYDGSTIKKAVDEFWNLTAGDDQYLGEFKNKVYYPCKVGNKCVLCGYDPATGTTLQFTNVQKPSSFAVAQNKLFFKGYDDAHGDELWSYSGAGAPSLALDAVPGTVSGCESTVISFKNDIYFIGPGTKFGVYGVDWELAKLVPATPNSIDNTSSSNAITLYPNPANDVVYLSNTNNQLIQNVQLTDLMGRVVTNMQGNDISSINIQNISPGYYYLRLVIADGSILVKPLSIRH